LANQTIQGLQENFSLEKINQNINPRTQPPPMNQWQQILAANTRSKYSQQILAANTRSKYSQQILAANTRSKYSQQILA
jgi:hypothetical protein